ncbi:hypothetical protein GCM10022206_41070 [Streptomyces chiangmaiensis]
MLDLSGVVQASCVRVYPGLGRPCGLPRDNPLDAGRAERARAGATGGAWARKRVVLPRSAADVRAMTDLTGTEHGSSPSAERKFGWWDMLVRPDDDPRGGPTTRDSPRAECRSLSVAPRIPRLKG